MKEKQGDPVTGEPRVFCSKHTRLFRDLNDDPDMLTNMTVMAGGEDGEDEDCVEVQLLGQNPDDDTFAGFNDDEEAIAAAQAREIGEELEAGGKPKGFGADDQNSFFHEHS